MTELRTASTGLIRDHIPQAGAGFRDQTIGRGPHWRLLGWAITLTPAPTPTPSSDPVARPVRRRSGQGVSLYLDAELPVGAAVPKAERGG